MVAVTIEYDRGMLPAVVSLLVMVFLARYVSGSWQGILRPQEVHVEEAIAEGESAVSRPGTPLARWRHVVSAPSDQPAVREVVVVTPYYRVAREAYRQALRGERLSPQEGRALLDRLVKEYGPFPLGLTLVFFPAPKPLPHPQAIVVKDASGRKLRLIGFTRPEGGREMVELILDANGADLRWLDLIVPLERVQHIRIDLRGIK